MAEVSQVLDNAHTEPELRHSSSGDKERMTDGCRKRFQLLDYRDVTKLSDVMETKVPIHGKGNFPSLEVTPSAVVQMVRDLLTKEGIRVPNVRLNGSAATHVLSGDGKHPYKDLDLIFAVDLSSYGDTCACRNTDINNNTSNLHYRNYKTPGYCQSRDGLKAGSPSWVQSPMNGPSSVDDQLAGEISGASDGGRSIPGSVSPTTILGKSMLPEDEDFEDKESGYTSGGSVASLPHSPAGCWVYQNPMRSRTHSLDSASSVTSSSYRDSCHVDFPRHGQRGFARDLYHDPCGRSKDSCWQKIKEVVMRLLRDLLPPEVTTSRMTDAMLTDAYVQKMVKITNDADRWSLFSLNNDTGRNLELKFVVGMRRQYEFSVDSFQIILDSYQRFKRVSRTLERSHEINLSQAFYPSVLAESVYGDFGAALRHLRHRRICTRRPEEIRGGGLLRYCNLRVRDFVPGEVEGHEDDVIADGDVTVKDDTGPYSTSKPDDVKRLEHLMCSRFFIDFGELARQQQKVMSYLDGHFQAEEDLKFQFLLIASKVVERGTVCLMSNEKSQILDFIKKMALETLAKDVSARAHVPPPRQQTPPCCSQQYGQPGYLPQYRGTPAQWNNNNNNNNGSYCYPQYPPPNGYAPGSIYPPPPIQYSPPNMAPSPYPGFSGYCTAPPDVPIALCPHCRSSYPQPPQPYCSDPPVTPSQHVMSVNSLPFYPSSRAPKLHPPADDNVTKPIIYLGKNTTLIYSAGPSSVASDSSPTRSGYDVSEPDKSDSDIVTQ